MVSKLRLNDKTVREQVPEPGRHLQVFDTELRGFSVRILSSGNRCFVLDFDAVDLSDNANVITGGKNDVNYHFEGNGGNPGPLQLH